MVIVSYHYVAFHSSSRSLRWLRGLLLLWWAMEDGEFERSTISKICLGNGGMTVLGNEDRVGDGVSEGKFSLLVLCIH